MSGDWTPKPGERVLAVLPDGHEIEGVWFGTYRHRPGSREVHIVVLPDDEQVFVRTVKPVPLPEPAEPTAFGARVIDGDGNCWLRGDTDGRNWVGRMGKMPRWMHWADLPRPITVVDADPSWDTL